MADYKSLVKHYFDQKGLKYTDSGDSFLSIDFGGKDLSQITIFIDFDAAGEGKAEFISFSIGTFDKDKYAQALVACNTCNSTYRWVKFYINDKNDICVRSDAILDENTCGAECIEIVMRMVGIIDDTYPVFMKARWA